MNKKVGRDLMSYSSASWDISSTSTWNNKLTMICSRALENARLNVLWSRRGFLSTPRPTLRVWGRSCGTDRTTSRRSRPRRVSRRLRPTPPRIHPCFWFAFSWKIIVCWVICVKLEWFVQFIVGSLLKFIIGQRFLDTFPIAAILNHRSITRLVCECQMLLGY